MGTKAAHTQADKSAIKRVYTGRTPIPTHNYDGNESPLEVLYRAASVARRGLKPTNLARSLPGGVSVGSVLVEAGIIEQAE